MSRLEAILTKAEQTLSTSKDEEEIIDDNPFFSKFVVIKNGTGIGTCTGVVQTSPEELTAFMYLTDTHEARDAHIAANGPDSSKYPTKQSVWSTITTTSPTLAEKCLLL